MIVFRRRCLPGPLQCTEWYSEGKISNEFLPKLLWLSTNVWLMSRRLLKEVERFSSLVFACFPLGLEDYSSALAEPGVIVLLEAKLSGKKSQTVSRQNGVRRVRPRGGEGKAGRRNGTHPVQTMSYGVAQGKRIQTGAYTKSIG